MFVENDKAWEMLFYFVVSLVLCLFFPCIWIFFCFFCLFRRSSRILFHDQTRELVVFKMGTVIPLVNASVTAYKYEDIVDFEVVSENDNAFIRVHLRNGHVAAITPSEECTMTVARCQVLCELLDGRCSDYA